MTTTTTMTTMTTMMKTTMTKSSTPRPVASWTKQIVSFGTSFAFFGLAGFLQTSAQAANEAKAAEAALAESQQFQTNTPPSQAEAAVLPAAAAENSDWLGPVALLPEANSAAQPIEQAPAPAPAPAAAPAPAPEPAPVVEEVPVDGHTGGS